MTTDMEGKRLTAAELTARAQGRRAKLIALDLDGTTLRSDRTVGERTRRALISAMTCGAEVVIATGRSLNSLPREVLSMQGIEYAITSNGAKIIRLADRRVLCTSYLAPPAVHEILRLLQPMPNVVEVFVDGQAYVEKEKFHDLARYGISGSSAEYVLATRKPMEGLFAFTEAHSAEVENINVRLLAGDVKQALWDLYAAVPGVTVTSSFPHNIEIGGEHTSKAEAMLTLAEMHGIARENVMACGDGLNDLAMLRAAGISVAMGNGVPEVLDAAEFITEDNDHDGVGIAVETFAL